MAAKSLIIGLLAGIFLALITPEFLYQLQAPLQNAEPGPASNSPLSPYDSMAQLLRNIARRGTGAYKSLGAAPGRATASFPTITASQTTSLASKHSYFSTTTAKMASQKSFLDAIKDRRTYYQLNKEAPISDQQITDLVEKAVLHVPSSFNSQSARLVVLLNKDHDQFWDYVVEVLKPLTPEDKFPATQQRIQGFRNAYGTILFYEDPEPVDALRKNFPIYAHHFGDWSEHTSAMHQFALWVALEAEGFGANLQHYNPVIDEKAAEHWNIPKQFKLRSQLVFGGRAGEPGEKQYQETFGKRIWVHGAKI